jgi:hypothetical protein
VFGVNKVGSTGTAEAMRITSAGNVGIGTSSPQTKTHIQSNAVSGATYRASAPLAIERNGDCELQIIGTSNSQIRFGNATTNFAGAVSYNHTIDSLLLFTNSSQRMVINSTGNVGIGTIDPKGSASLTGTLQLGFSSQINGRTPGSGLYLTDNISFTGDPGQTFSNAQYIGTTMANGLVLGGGELRYYTAPAGTAGTSATLTERLRIDVSGQLLIGSTTAISAGTGTADGVTVFPVGAIVVSRNNLNTLELRRRSGDGPVAIFRRDTTEVGSISVTTTATTYNTSSDYRLKEDAQPIANPSERLLALKPVNFAWKADGSRMDGFMAHEAQEVVPEAVTGEKDAVDKDGNPEYQGIDQSKIVPLLTAALQEALTEIAALKERVAALET